MDAAVKPFAEPTAVTEFVARWKDNTGSERANFQSFMRELCELLQLPLPDPGKAENDHNAYVFERFIAPQRADSTTEKRYIDLYRRDCFVLEGKQTGKTLATQSHQNAINAAVSQAERYVRGLPLEEVEHGRPPFVVVVDVGNAIYLFAEFSRTGGNYVAYPDPRHYEIRLDDLHKPEVQDRLRRLWLDPHSLDPSKHAARVTKQVSATLAQLAKSLEQSGFEVERVANFLKRCLFTMFAEDVELLPKGSFHDLLVDIKDRNPEAFPHAVKALWETMNTGGYSERLMQTIKRFNGGLFKGIDPIPLTVEQIQLLIDAAKADWRFVEPAIFGTLLERALDPRERHKLGAHYTPRAYVERLVMPTLIEPLREQWGDVRAAAETLLRHGKPDKALQEAQAFHYRLCQTRVLDPACGSANFLYVTLEHLKRLEGEVVNQLEALGHTQDQLGFEGETVTLQQLRGIELNERAAALAELVLWIGYLQWHIRTRGNAAVAEPVVHNYGNIECRDAVLAWDAQELAYDDAGQLLSRWDGTTYKTHPVTGEQVPDEAAQVPQWRYVGARQAEWPQADFIVGNPPFIGAASMRAALGDGYVQALRGAWPEVPESADFVMFWWHHAAAQVAAGHTRRMGLITTNSLRQTFNRRVVQAALDKGCHLHMAIPDHPWVDGANGAAVRIAMTVLAPSAGEGCVQTVTTEQTGDYGEVAVTLSERRGLIHADLSAGANVAAAIPLQACQGITFRGVTLMGSGFWVEQDDALITNEPGALKPILNGRDLAEKPRNAHAIDFFGLNREEARTRFPGAYQRVLEAVKPQRDANANTKDGAAYADRWWVFAKPRPEMRRALAGTSRFIATPMTAKHRTFQFVSAKVLPDQGLIVVAHDDSFCLGLLSSQAHITWALATGARLGVGNDPRYNNSRCFETFPFPDEDTGLTPQLRERIAQLAEQIDAHRKRVLAPESGNTGLTLTGLYNVLAALREGRALTAKEKTHHTQGLVGVLRELHDELDAAVLAAYGLPATATTDDILAHLVQLNTQRAAEEAQGRVRWLRPDFQNPQNSLQKQELLAQEDQAPEADFDSEKPLSKTEQSKPAAQNPWPATLPEQVRAVADALAASPTPLTLSAIEARFKGRGPWKKGLPTLLQTLEALGRAQAVAGGGVTAWRG